MATIKDVAKKAGVGISSVSRYLNKSGYVSEENKAKIEKAISELNYKPSYIARTLKARHAYMVALFVPTISHPFFCKIAYYIEQFLNTKYTYYTFLYSHIALYRLLYLNAHSHSCPHLIL